MGLEEFKKTVIRNTIIRVVGVAAVFIFVKDSGDLNLYIFINAFVALLGQVILWIDIKKYLVKTSFKDLHLFRHITPIYRLFIPQLAIQLYIVLDKTMLGILSSFNETGYYEQASKIIKLSLVLVTTLGTVMMPRMSNLYAKNNIEEGNQLLKKSFVLSLYLAVPITFGLIGISNEFVGWFFGSEFIKVKSIMMLMSPIVIAISISNVIGMQYLVPKGHNTKFTISVIAGAVINIVFNLILIPKYGSLGATFSTLLAEFTVTFIQLFIFCKLFNIKFIMINTYKFFIGALFMIVVVRIIGTQLPVSPIIITLTQIIIGMLIYFIILIITKERNTYDLIKKMKSLMKR